MASVANDIWTCARTAATDVPLAVLHSAGRGRWSNHSICAEAHGVLRIDRDGARWIAPAPHPAGSPPKDPLEALDWAHHARRFASRIDGVPAAGGWVAVLSYELGELLEPAVNIGPGPSDDRRAPLAELLWCPDPIVRPAGPLPCSHVSMRRGDVVSELDPESHVRAIERTIEYIRAGDIFQANIARRMHMPVQGHALGWAQRATGGADAPFGAMVRLPDNPDSRIIASMSPELFLHVDETGTITSRPIKGTAGSAQSPNALAASEKDAAELHMIVDLVRNDLGRICRTGSVEVTAARALETHATVHHGVAEIRGQLRDDTGLVDLLRATFPPGSVTGAPKIRAMQIIREIEPRPRGAYCGAIGLLGPGGATMLSVGIRTATLHGRLDGHAFEGTLDYGTGGGITTGSDPRAELQETRVKARALDASFRRSGDDRCRAPESPAAIAATPCVDATGSR